MFTRKLIRGTVMGLTALVALAGMPKNSSAQEVLKFGHVYEVDTPYHRAALKASELFAERTDGRYKIEVFPASQLGKEAAINEALTLGSIDIIYTGVAYLRLSLYAARLRTLAELHQVGPVCRTVERIYQCHRQ